MTIYLKSQMGIYKNMGNLPNLAWYQDPQWYAIIVALIVGLLSFFKEHFFLAKVGFDFKVISPNCHKTKISYKLSSGKFLDKKPCYYYRLKVFSKNRVAPEKLELMITKKWKKNGDEFVLDNTFLPMSLKWSHYSNPILDNIAPELFKFCDFGSIIHPDFQNDIISEFEIPINHGSVSMYMDLEIRPYTGTHILLPNIYRFEFSLSGKNFKKISKIFEIEFPDYWNDDENQMLNHGLKTKEV